MGIDATVGNGLLVLIDMSNVFMACHDTIISSVCLDFDSMRGGELFETMFSLNGLCCPGGIMTFYKYKSARMIDVNGGCMKFSRSGFTLVYIDKTRSGRLYLIYRDFITWLQIVRVNRKRRG